MLQIFSEGFRGPNLVMTRVGLLQGLHDKGFAGLLRGLGCTDLTN